MHLGEPRPPFYHQILPIIQKPEQVVLARGILSTRQPVRFLEATRQSEQHLSKARDCWNRVGAGLLAQNGNHPPRFKARQHRARLEPPYQVDWLRYLQSPQQRHSSQDCRFQEQKRLATQHGLPRRHWHYHDLFWPVTHEFPRWNWGISSSWNFEWHGRTELQLWLLVPRHYYIPIT